MDYSEQCVTDIHHHHGWTGHDHPVVGCKMWKNLVVTLLIATLIGFLIVCAINFVFGDRLQFLWGAPQTGDSNFMLEMGLMSLLIGGVSTFIIMLGTLVAKSNSRNQGDED